MASVCISERVAWRHSQRALDGAGRMNTLPIKPLVDQPSDIVLFPDFVISAMLCVGPCLVEADATVQQERLVEFWRKQRATGEGSVIGRPPPRFFRPMPARFAK